MIDAEQYTSFLTGIQGLFSNTKAAREIGLIVTEVL
jgi:hypothetical protein